ncbi:unnamed protein product [Acanthoscelides obtectus]|nr:unnamed protein product [Acanthoscelides obtectus]CAK1629463.1 DNA topoisomerase 3-alpha [Acanthoscelides obtectus]
MMMTSVSGHLLNYQFAPSFKNWHSCSPVALFDAPVLKTCQPDYENIKKTLEREIRTCQGLIIWTDCDREGENIGFEIIKVCTDVKPNLRIYRAKFSEITGASIFRALNTLGQPNKNVSDAVDVRMELDLRTGAAFTRLQTLRLQKVFPQKLADKLISYGSCQFPTLGFVVERYKAIEEFIPEDFWKIKMNHTVKEVTTDFNWKRERLFDKNTCQAILDICKENPQATVENVESREKSKWRPTPLDTVEMEKIVSRKLKINAKETMKIAEKLYMQGYISYPRTETNIFPKELNLVNLVEQQRQDHRWGSFASRIMEEGGPTPRQGRKSDQAHPPIHPTKYANNLAGNDQRLYEYIVRHFLACLHKDAKGFETTVNVDIAGEKFQAKGLVILEKNYLDVYVYDKWNAKEIWSYRTGDTFMPTVLEMVGGSTSPPKLLTEADLIALMEKHGIGTDATHAEHIDKIKSREYVGLHENIYFVPGNLGMGLVEGYNNIGLEVSLAKPVLRAEFENDLKLICDGLKSPETVRTEQIAKYRAVFETVMEKIRCLDESLGHRLDDRPQDVPQDRPTSGGGANNFRSVLKCPKCGSDMFVRERQNGGGKYIGCANFPNCKNAIWFTSNVESIEVMDGHCPDCGPNTKKLKMKFRQNPFPGEPNPNVLCIAGCEENVLEALDISRNSVTSRQNGTVASNNATTHNATTNDSVNPSSPSANNWNFPSNPHSTTTSSRNTGQTNDWSGGSTTNRPSLGSVPMNSNTAVGTGNEDIVCSCNKTAILLTVRKDGPNKGRQFYKCGDGACNFFLWAPDPDASTSESARTSFGNAQQNVRCTCGQPACLRTVNKEGPNKGRQFYCCPKPMGEGCKFFKWADEDDPGFGGGNDGDGGGGGGGGGGFRTANTSNWHGKAATSSKKKNDNRSAPYNASAKPRAKRKCGICGEEGHIRTKCPNNN